MKEFKAGDLVFEILNHTGITLATLESSLTYDGKKNLLEIDERAYLTNGKTAIGGDLQSIFHATPEMRQNLVAIWGEDAVPKLPLRGSDLTKKLLESQNMQACFCAETNDDDARKGKNLNLIVRYKDGYFWTNGGEMFGSTYSHAVPVDNYGNEITELPSN